MSEASDRLNELKTAAKEYLTKERRRLKAEKSFLEGVFQGRGASAQVEDSNSKEASSILVDSINAYLEK